MVFIETAKRLTNYNKVIVTSELGRRLCRERGLEGEFLVTTRETEFGSVILTYVRRVVKALCLGVKVKGGDVLLGTSDFLPDVLPIFVRLLRHPERQRRIPCSGGDSSPDRHRDQNDGSVTWIQHIFHLIPSSRKIPFIFQRLSFWLIKRAADLVVVDNSLLREDLGRLGFDLNKVVVNYPGIDLEYLRSIEGRNLNSPEFAKEKSQALGISSEPDSGELANSFPSDSEGYDGIFMAQFRESKGIFDLPQIWKLVCQEMPAARLGIIGKGSEELVNKLRLLIKSLGMGNNIDLLGYLEDDEAFAMIKSSRVLVFPSREEGFGIVPLESQALGLPVVAWNLPVFEEVFPEGMVKIEVGDFEEFAEDVLRLLTDKGFYDKLSSGAQANAGRFNWDEAAARFRELVASI